MFKKPDLQDIVEALCVLHVVAKSPEELNVRSRAERIVSSIGYNRLSREAAKLKYDSLSAQMEDLRLMFPGISDEQT